MPRQNERTLLALVVLLALAALPARAAEPASVLVLEQEDPGRPAYVTFSYLGFGMVRGSCISFVELGREVAEQTAAIIRGGGTTSVPMILSGAHRLLFDWREMQPYGLSATRLPSGSDVQFRPASIWEAQRGVVIVIAAALLVQSGLFVALLAELRRRRLAENSLRESEERQSLAAESAKVGFWSLDKSSGRFWAPARTLELWGLDSGITVDLQRLLRLVHPEDRGMMRQTVEHARAGRAGQAEQTDRRRTWHPRTHRQTPSHQHHHEVAGAIGRGTDVVGSGSSLSR